LLRTAAPGVKRSRSLDLCGAQEKRVRSDDALLARWVLWARNLGVDACASDMIYACYKKLSEKAKTDGLRVVLLRLRERRAVLPENAHILLQLLQPPKPLPPPQAPLAPRARVPTQPFDALGHLKRAGPIWRQKLQDRREVDDLDEIELDMLEAVVQAVLNERA